MKTDRSNELSLRLPEPELPEFLARPAGVRPPQNDFLRALFAVPGNPGTPERARHPARPALYLNSKYRTGDLP